jgi:hypothetical protein
MYSPDPARWFANVLAACEYFLMIDLVRRRRHEHSEFDVDGDCMRFAVGDARPRVDTFFDLESLGDRLLACRTYNTEANAHDSAPIHFIALLRGDLATLSREPPSGISSAVAELSSQTTTEAATRDAAGGLSARAPGRRVARIPCATIVRTSAELPR